MPKVLVVVHNSFDAKFLPNFFKRVLPEGDVLSIPLCANEAELNHCIDQLPKDIDVIIVESNYGTPASNLINEQLLNALLGSFPGAIVVATSSTMHSLDAAMRFDSRIMIMGKGNLKPDSCDLNRVQSLTTLKSLLLQPQQESTLSLTPSFELAQKKYISDTIHQVTESSMKKPKRTG